MSLDTHLLAARTRQHGWDGSRHDRVRASIERVHHARASRRRVLSVALSTAAGAALFALAVRAFGFSSEAPGPEAQIAPAPAATYADGGFRVDATLRD